VHNACANALLLHLTYQALQWHLAFHFGWYCVPAWKMKSELPSSGKVVLVNYLKYNKTKYQNYPAGFLFFQGLFRILFKFLGQLIYFIF
jgi:hypothetical protein